MSGRSCTSTRKADRHSLPIVVVFITAPFPDIFIPNLISGQALVLLFKLCTERLWAIFGDDVFIQMISKRHNVNGKDGLQANLDRLMMRINVLTEKPNITDV